MEDENRYCGTVQGRRWRRKPNLFKITYKYHWRGADLHLKLLTQPLAKLTMKVWSHLDHSPLSCGISVPPKRGHPNIHLQGQTNTGFFNPKTPDSQISSVRYLQEWLRVRYHRELKASNPEVRKQIMWEGFYWSWGWKCVEDCYSSTLQHSPFDVYQWWRAPLFLLCLREGYSSADIIGVIEGTITVTALLESTHCFYLFTFFSCIPSHTTVSFSTLIM